MKIQNLFTSGKMNKDLDERLIPQGEYRDALNIKVANSTGSDVGAIENGLSNEAKSSLDLGSNAVCIGSISDDEDRVVYWFVKSDTGCFICYYDQKTNTSEILMSDTRLLTNQNPEKSVLNFSEAHMIQANILTDADNLKKFLYFTDGLNPPRRINVATAKGYEVNGFTDEDINVIVKPPLHAPSIQMEKTYREENNIEEKFLSFAYRYIYEDGERSSLSPFSETAFTPGAFAFDFLGAINNSMKNFFSGVKLTYNTGSNLVKEIEIVFKESENNSIYIAANISKEKKSLPDNSDQYFDFKNNNIYKTLPEDEIFRLYDNVPLVAETQEIINNRLVYGNYVENFDLVDENDNDTLLDLTAGYTTVGIVDESPENTAKSNVDYEVGLVYLDDYGRSTTVLTSENNSTYVKPSDAINKNTLTATISSKAPRFAKYYRLFVKQSKKSDYDILSPITSYEQNEFLWIRLEGDDKNKIKEDDYLIVKSDIDGVKRNVVKTKVLDSGVKEKNFLQPEGYTGATEQESGFYIKIASTGVNISEDIYRKHVADDYDNTKEEYGDNTNQDFINQSINYIEGPFLYSTINGSLKDATMSGTLTSGESDKRFEIEIFSSGAIDEFRWRSYSHVDSQGQFTKGNWSSPINCSTTPILLDHGMSITFGSVTGHNQNDIFSFNVKGNLYNTYLNLTNTGPFFSPFSRTYIVLNGLTPSDSSGFTTENILPGSKIILSYKEYSGRNEDKSVNDFNLLEEQIFYSKYEYDNIEEWYWSEGLEKLIELGFDAEGGIRFRRGIYSDSTEANNQFTVTGSTSDPLCMIIRSNFVRSSNSPNLYATAKWSVFGKLKDTYIILETIASKNNSDVFYEVPGTYEVDNCGYHKGLESYDVDQGFNNPATIRLNFMNAYSFGNGFECYKIRDAFIADSLSSESRPLTYIENYRRNHRNVSVTYSDVYEQSTNYNGLNEFNLSRVNYIDLDDEYGDIKRIHSRDTNLVVFQENKVSYLPYQKSILYNADGSGNVAQSLNVFGNQVPYSGEYGISSSAHSFTSWANRMYFADERRGAIMRLSQDGLTEISQFGMRDWFRDNVDAKNENVILGGYDPFNGQYVVSIKDPVLEWREDAFKCLPASCDLKATIFLTPATTTTTTAAPGTTTTTTAAPGTTTTTTTQAATSTTTTTTIAQQTCYAHQLQYDATTSCQGSTSVYYSDSNVWCQSTKLFMSSSACAADDSNGYAPTGYYTYEVAPGSFEYSYWNGNSFSQMCTPC